MSVAAHVLKRTGVASMALVALTLVLVVPDRAVGQDQNSGQGQGQGGRGGPGGGGRGNFDPDQIRRQIAERMKERIGASDEEWSVIQPKVEKVMQIQRQSAGGGGMGMLFGRGRGGPGGDRRDRGGDRGDRGGRRGGFFGGDEDSPVAQARRELEKSVEANASADELKAKMAALREARAKSREELNKAQQELRELLTMKQEAALVMMGMLE